MPQIFMWFTERSSHIAPPGWSTIYHGATWAEDKMVKTINKLLAKWNNYMAPRWRKIKTEI